MMLGRPAKQLDLAARHVVLNDGEQVAHDYLVLATGARARPSPWSCPQGLRVLRTLADAEALRQDLRGGGSVVIVVGGGFIGAEVATSARSLSCQVTAPPPSGLRPPSRRKPPRLPIIGGTHLAGSPKVRPTTRWCQWPFR